MAEQEPDWVADWLNIARENPPTWHYYAGGQAPTKFRDFWGDVTIRCPGRYYQASLFCGYVRHETIYGNNVGPMILHYKPEDQKQEVINFIQQIWEMDQQRGNKPVPSNFIYAIKPDQKAEPDSEQDLEIGRLVQQYFAGEANFYLKTSLNMDNPWCPLVTRVISGEEIPTNGVGIFYSDAAYHDLTCPEKVKANGAIASKEIGDCLDKGEKKVSIFGGKECGALDTYWDIKAYLRGDVKNGQPKKDSKCYFRFYNSHLGTLFIRNGIAILSKYDWAAADFDLGNIRYPVYGMPDDEFRQMANQMWDLYHKQLCQKR